MVSLGIQDDPSTSSEGPGTYINSLQSPSDRVLGSLEYERLRDLNVRTLACGTYGMGMDGLGWAVQPVLKHAGVSSVNRFVVQQIQDLTH